MARLVELPGEPMRFAAMDSGRTEALTACQVRLLLGPSHVLHALAVSCFIAGNSALLLIATMKGPGHGCCELAAEGSGEMAVR